MIKKLFCFLLIFSLCVSPMAFADEPKEDTSTEQTDDSSSEEKSSSSSTPPEIKSNAAVVMDADSGQILYQKNMSESKAPASITKLMTALLVFQKSDDLEEQITVNASALEGISGTTTIGLSSGEKVTVGDMLYAMMLSSANDAANVLAEYVSGTQEKFVQKMNSTAKSLGCTNTTFANASGLDDEDQQTTAYDMALIAQALFSYEDFLTIAGAESYTMDPTNQYDDTRTFDSKISFLFSTSQYYDADVLGAKTGWTSNANHTLVTFAQRDDRKLVVVNLDCTSKYQKFQDVIDMLDYSFDAFKPVTVSASDLYKTAVKDLKESGEKPKESSFSDIVVYLTQGNSEDSLSYSFKGGNSPKGTIVFTNAAGDQQELVTFEYALEKTEAAAQDNQTKKKSPLRILFKIILVLVILWLAFYGYIIYVNRERAKRKRRRERERKKRERNRNNQDSY